MKPGNRTIITGFILLGFSAVPSDAQIALFVSFLLTYFITLLGNFTIISLIAKSPTLHTPMYFFLFNISFVDIGTASVTAPRLLVDIIMDWKYIAFNDCFAQIFTLVFLVGTEVFLLCVMCYDRYVAICLPLNYTMVMTWSFCFWLISCSWMSGFLHSFIFIMQISKLSFCGDVIDHFVCEIPTLLRLACTDTLPNENIIIAVAGCTALITFLVIFISYIYIIRVIFKIPSKEGRRKAFTTCSTHLMVVILLFGTGSSTHLKYSSSSNAGVDKVTSLFYTVFVPMLNPIIYSLRNEDVKKAASYAKQNVGK